MSNDPVFPRRDFLRTGLGIGASLALATVGKAGVAKDRITRPIHSSKEQVPVIGMGSWQTFDVGRNQTEVQTRIEVLKTFFNNGGGMIDSSPMYGSSEEVIGFCLRQLNYPSSLLSATKVWTWGKQSGINQMELSRKLWGVECFDLMQIHNMLDWESHLETLKDMKGDIHRFQFAGPQR